jgi:hypothetical protein
MPGLGEPRNENKMTRLSFDHRFISPPSSDFMA